ncbi:MAG TPA: hypothetical protein VL635_18850 [Trinickia sp.]|nr:hypothetical protein [Trinickia sp.]
MPLVSPLSFRSRAVLAALGLAVAALAAPRQAQADEPAEQALASVNLTEDALAPGAAALDDYVLARQRGTGPGLMAVAVSGPMLHGSHSVTLWDEIAPPSPVPVPADASQVAQGNAVSYFRK